MCLLFQEPKTLKSNEELAVCFDLLFAVFRPTLQKTLIVQSDFSWTMLILSNITSYFRPIIPLLTFICEEFILSIKMDDNGRFGSNPKFTHNTFLTAIASTLITLQAIHWETLHEVNCPPRKAVPPESVALPYPQFMTSTPPLHVPQQVATASSSAPPLDTPPSYDFPSSPKVFEQDFDSQPAPKSPSTLQVPKQFDTPHLLNWLVSHHAVLHHPSISHVLTWFTDQGCPLGALLVQGELGTHLSAIQGHPLAAIQNAMLLNINLDLKPPRNIQKLLMLCLSIR